jgi:hypothetical protein
MGRKWLPFLLVTLYLATWLPVTQGQTTGTPAQPVNRKFNCLHQMPL